MKTLKICEVFHSFQFEGKHIGLNATFIRLSGCNLNNCVFCDSTYHNEGDEFEISEIVKKIKGNNVVITGGEPLTQDIYPLVSQTNKFIIVETNGTIIPSKQLLKKVDHWSVSPKLSSSGNDIDKRMNYDALDVFNKQDSIFKFVITNEKDIEEVQFLQDQIKIPNEKIWLMKEGKTKEEQYCKIEEFISLCRQLGYNFSPRVHIMIFDNKRKI